MSAGRIPWARIVTEGLAIIGSILIAFAIDRWWDGRHEIAFRQQLFSGLETGFTANVRLAGEEAEAATADQALLRRFVSMSPDEAAGISSDSTWIYLRAPSKPRMWRTSANQG